MDTFIVEGDVDGLKAFVAKAMASNSSEGSILEGMIECQVRERAMLLVREKASLEVIRKHLGFVSELSKTGSIQKTTAITTIQDMMDVSSISHCKFLFGIVEEMITDSNIHLNVLRMCNDLLKRLSRTVETSFCGRILSFLGRFLPLMEKSGLNLVGQFNTHNTTKFDTGETEFTDLLATNDENMETGEIEESKESLIAVDSNFYQQFWKMQAFFANPNMCFDLKNFKIFHSSLTEICQTLATHKLEKFSYDSNAKASTTAAELVEETEKYFAKYLTSTKLLQLQLNDSQFRRNFLLQVLIVLQFLIADPKGKVKQQELTEEQTKICQDAQDKCYKLLRDTYPKGYGFVDNVKIILGREKEWTDWKNQNCYDMDRRQDKSTMGVYKKRPRTHFDPEVVDMGSAELTRLWSLEPHLKKACRERKFIPTVEEFIRDPLDELDPEQQVDEEYKSINLPAFQWRASRFLMTEAEAYWAVKGESKDITEEIAPFVAKVICQAGGKQHYLLQQAKKNNGDVPRSPETKVTADVVDQLADVVSKSNSLDTLIEKLFPDFEKQDKEENSIATRRLMKQFAETKGFSIQQIATTFLAAQLYSEEVTNVLMPSVKA